MDFGVEKGTDKKCTQFWNPCCQYFSARNVEWRASIAKWGIYISTPARVPVNISQKVIFTAKRDMPALQYDLTKPPGSLPCHLLPAPHVDVSIQKGTQRPWRVKWACRTCLGWF